MEESAEEVEGGPIGQKAMDNSAYVMSGRISLYALWWYRRSCWRSFINTLPSWSWSPGQFRSILFKPMSSSWFKTPKLVVNEDKTPSHALEFLLDEAFLQESYDERSMEVNLNPAGDSSGLESSSLEEEWCLEWCLEFLTWNPAKTTTIRINRNVVTPPIMTPKNEDVRNESLSLSWAVVMARGGFVLVFVSWAIVVRRESRSLHDREKKIAKRIFIHRSKVDEVTTTDGVGKTKKRKRDHVIEVRFCQRRGNAFHFAIRVME